jgi:hypothetical protein
MPTPTMCPSRASAPGAEPSASPAHAPLTPGPAQAQLKPTRDRTHGAISSHPIGRLGLVARPLHGRAGGLSVGGASPARHWSYCRAVGQLTQNVRRASGYFGERGYENRRSCRSVHYWGIVASVFTQGTSLFVPPNILVQTHATPAGSTPRTSPPSPTERLAREPVVSGRLRTHGVSTTTRTVP